MPSIYKLKTKFQNLLRPLCHRLEKAGITANQVTLFALFLSILAATALAAYPELRIAILAYPAVLFIRMALNAIDGMLAREFNQKSKLGAFLNELGDILSDAALYLALGFIPGVCFPLAALFAILAVTTEATGCIAVQIGASRRYDGPMGKSDRAFVIGAWAAFGGIWPSFLVFTNPLLIILSLLCLLTIWNRIRKALQETRYH